MYFPNPAASSYPFGEVLSLIHVIILIIFAVMYLHHSLFLVLSLFVKPKKYKEATKNHKYAYIIAARNEEKVIGNLIKSINEQNYPKELMTVFVFADNCTDNTAKIARENGAIVYERHNTSLIGKSYVLDEAFKWIFKNYDNQFEAFMIFDADNLVDKNFTKEMNKAYDSNHLICTSFRNSKNYGENWIASGSAMLFYRECCIMHPVRSALNTTAYVSGTGFLVDQNIIKQNGGWIHHNLIEDIQFSIDEYIKGVKTYYVPKAVFYDEQPTTFKDSWNQRLRWCRGNHQCFLGYEHKLIKSFFKKGGFGCIDLGTHIFPSPVITFCWLLILPIIYGIYALCCNVPFEVFFYASVKPLLDCFFFGYIYAFFTSILITIMIWKKLKTSTIKKLWSCFTFPIYMFFYLPINTIAMFKKVKWVPIKHTCEISMNDIDENYIKEEEN